MDDKSLIESLDRTPAQLARELGVSDGHIHDIKSGRRRLTLGLAASIEALTGRRDIVEHVVARSRRSA